MSLKQKFQKISGCTCGDTYCTCPYISEPMAVECEKISYEFAIGFMNWCIKNYKIEGIFIGILDDKELLEIYKTIL